MYAHFGDLDNYFADATIICERPIIACIVDKLENNAKMASKRREIITHISLSFMSEVLTEKYLIPVLSFLGKIRELPQEIFV